MNRTNIVKILIKDIWPYVDQQGWTWQAMATFCHNHELEIGHLKLEFPGGLDEILITLNDELDREIRKKIDKNLGVTNTLKKAMEYKIDFKLCHKNAFKKILNYLLKPPRPFLSLKIAFKTVNRFWYCAGDQSTDYNYYSKRMLLMYIYVPTMLCLLTRNKTKDDVIGFMNRRFHEVALIPKLKQKIKNFI